MVNCWWWWWWCVTFLLVASLLNIIVDTCICVCNNLNVESQFQIPCSDRLSCSYVVLDARWYEKERWCESGLVSFLYLNIIPPVLSACTALQIMLLDTRCVLYLYYELGVAVDHIRFFSTKENSACSKRPSLKIPLLSESWLQLSASMQHQQIAMLSQLQNSPPWLLNEQSIPPTQKLLHWILLYLGVTVRISLQVLQGQLSFRGILFLTQLTSCLFSMVWRMPLVMEWDLLS